MNNSSNMNFLYSRINIFECVYNKVLVKSKKVFMKKVFFIIVGIIFLVSILLNIGMYHRISKPVEVKSDTVVNVSYDTIRDTLPDVRYETIVKYIKVPPNDTVFKYDTITKEVTLPVVQRQYGDSTYSAYVSGINIPPYPCLDSIMVRQRTIERTITNTVYKTKHWRYGIGASAGISLTTHKPDIIIGGFVGYSF